MPVIITGIFSCMSYKLPDNLNNDFSTRGPLTNDVFQVIVTRSPDKGIKTHTGQRENARNTAKNNIQTECILQMLQYYTQQKKLTESDIPRDQLAVIKEKLSDFAEDARIEQEYFLADNSAVLIVRIYEYNIANKILNY